MPHAGAQQWEQAVPLNCGMGPASPSLPAQWSEAQEHHGEQAAGAGDAGRRRAGGACGAPGTARQAQQCPGTVWCGSSGQRPAASVRHATRGWQWRPGGAAIGAQLRHRVQSNGAAPQASQLRRPGMWAPQRGKAALAAGSHEPGSITQLLAAV